MMKNETLDIQDGCFLIKSTQPVRRDNMRIAQMPKYREPHFSTTEANTLSWQRFKDSIDPLVCIQSRDAITEFIVTQKSVPWTVEDINIWSGSHHRAIDTISNFTPLALADLFKIHVGIAQTLLQEGKASQWGFGFNPQDFSQGHHSIRRFHTHIRGLNNAHDSQNIKMQSWRSCNWFERLTAFEPFASIAGDVITALLKKSNIQPLHWFSPRLHKSGYVTYEADSISDYEAYATAFKQLYENGQQAYEGICNIFSDGAVDPDTDRYLPLPQEVRLSRYNQFAHDNIFHLSKPSLELLRYLTINIQRASPRLNDGKVQINDSSQIHITKGFAGGFMFTTGKDGKTFADFFPRIITTTGPTKNLHADEISYGFIKTDNRPSPEMIEENIAFAKKIASITQNIQL